MTKSDLECIDSLEINLFDTSASTSKYLASYGARYFEISESVAVLLQLLQKTKSFKLTAEQYSLLRGKSYTEEEISRIYYNRILPVIKSNKKNGKTFLWKRELVNQNVIDKIQAYFRWFFRPVVIVVVLVCIVISEILFFTSGTSVSIGRLDMTLVIGVLLLFLLSSCAHELGHATASSYFGQKVKGIGIGIYLNFPVFYTDVSNIWRIPRKQRLVVNFAGVYFQLLFLIPFILTYLITDNQILKFYIYTINLNFVFVLNPFFKFDGYWIISDLIGMPNLRSKTNMIFSYFKALVFHKKDPVFSEIRPGAKWILIIYSIMTNLFFAYYLCYVIPQFIKSFVSSFPNLIKNLVIAVSSGTMPPIQLISSVVGQLVVMSLICFSVYKIFFSQIIHKHANKISK